MGSGVSKRGKLTSKAWNSRMKTNGNCDCVPFSMQGHCLSNRHLHAFKEGTDLIIVDLSFHKEIVISDVFSPLHDLRPSRKYVTSTGLELCNVVCFQWDFAVVQVFHREYVRFYICDCTKRVCISSYTKTFGVLGLCECYITADREFLFIKQNFSHWKWNMGRSSQERLPQIEMVKLSKSKDHCELTESIDRNMEIAICTHPRKSRVYFAYFSDITLKAVVLGHNLRSSKSLSSLFDGVSVFNRFINLQITQPGDIMYVSVLGQSNNVLSESMIPAVCRSFCVTVKMIKTSTLEVLRSMEYISLSGIRMFAPVISSSGKYVYVNDQLSYIAPCIGVKSLKLLCQELLTELVLPEDIDTLPLPNPLKHIVMYGMSR